MRFIAWLGALTVALIGSSANAVAETDATPEQIRFFETSVRPLLIEKCQKCHGEEKQWGQLRLDSREALLKGGEGGVVVVSGQPEESRLIQAVRHLDESFRMPPKEKLSDQQIAVLVRWVEMGAPFPGVTSPAKSRTRNPNHWAFQQVANARVPATKTVGWSDSRWDQFILVKLEAAGITPSPTADGRTLLRRATYDLTGLPPAPADIADFLNDDRPDAFSRLIDRLLASPTYGESWGRHWLDVARYADSNGLDENIAHGNAWRYRDYVIGAFNEDQPYNDFITEQIAGDLLPAARDDDRRRFLTATGFLSLGPKVLAEVDETKMEMDIIDEQVDTVGRSILGLTLGCARCHDHKFDPIEAADYYGMAGIFKSTRTMEHFKKIAKWNENTLPGPMTRQLQADYDAQVAQKKAAVQEFVAKADARVKSMLAEGAALPASLEEKYSEESKAELKRLRDELAQLEKSPPELPSAMGVGEGTPVDLAIHIRGNPLKLGDVVGRRVPVVLAKFSNPTFSSSQSGRLELARWLTAPDNPLTSRVFVNRAWRWHFGKGIVRTTDNFGLQGEAPSHPEMLDALAREFVTSGWSLKRLHRQLMESRVYQLASYSGRVEMDKDPDNRLFSHAEIRRLEAEAVRDALIAVGNRLDQRMGQSLLTVKNRAFFFDHTSKDLTDYTSQRRSIYLPVVRNNVFDVFQLLDFPDAAVPSGDRPTTTIAPQALMMMNSDFVLNCSADFTNAVLATANVTAEQRIQQAYLRAYGREPSDVEVREALSYLEKIERAFSNTAPAGESQRRAWSSLCHVILCSNEFIYLK